VAGIYIHIPFCRQKCHYCNFHFSVSLKNKALLLEAILREIELNHDFLSTDRIDTLYFGGGTPSVLRVEELSAIVEKLRQYFTLGDESEFTLEANPDDLNVAYLDGLRRIGVNRLSVGIQSFIDDDLTLMNRSHDAAQARKAFRLMKEAGFADYSIDLIFGMPGSDIRKWEKNLEEALSYQAPHFSMYNLTVEPRTALEHMIKTRTIAPLEEGKMAEQFLFTVEYMLKAGYEHYEISNYSLPGRYARHNTAYWQGKPYLGIGPSAHSFRDDVRQWNVASNARYIRAIQNGELPFERERLSPADRYNEYIMTRLRTMWGVSGEEVSQLGQVYFIHFKELLDSELEKGRIKKQQERYVLTLKGKLFADEVASNLFMDASSSK
jgi:oxygen-independent coproporphyrinogen-3 oxidase